MSSYMYSCGLVRFPTHSSSTTALPLSNCLPRSHPCQAHGSVHASSPREPAQHWATVCSNLRALFHVLLKAPWHHRERWLMVSTETAGSRYQPSRNSRQSTQKAASYSPVHPLLCNTAVPASPTKYSTRVMISLRNRQGRCELFLDVLTKLVNLSMSVEQL